MSFKSWKKELLKEFAHPPNFFDYNDDKEWVVVGRFWDCGSEFNRYAFDGCMEEALSKAKAIQNDIGVDLDDNDIESDSSLLEMRSEGIVQLDVRIEAKNRPNPKRVAEIVSHYL